MAQAAPEIRSIWPYQSKAPVLLPLASTNKERSIGLRASTRMPVALCEGSHAAHCLALELSATGVVVDRGRVLSEREEKALFRVELFLPDQRYPVRVLARVARRARRHAYAMKFVLISDVDRLTLMEHLDHEALASLELLQDVERASSN